MSSLLLRNYGDFFQTQLGLASQRKNHFNDKGFFRQQTSFAPVYPIQPYHQSGMKTELLTLPNQLDAQYQRNANRIQKCHWKQQANNAPLFMHTMIPNLFSSTYITATVYPNEKETRFKSYSSVIGFDRDMDYNYPSYAGYPSSSVSIFGAGNNGGYIGLVPKIRMIFIPTGFSSNQQSCAGPLTMPPFLFNRMSQPLCSLPPPPPPLPLSPTVQQMVIQRYANPVAVLPFTSNWQMSQPIVSTYPQQQQSMMLQYSNNSYPSTCRASLPDSPFLDIQVNGHCWIQHCSTCHHVSATAFNPNARPTGGRVTPLLRYPAVSQYVDNQPIQLQHRHPHTNTPTTMRPWLHNIPPLPPGAIIVSDEYITKDDSSRRYRRLRKYEKEHQRLRKSIELSRTITPSSAHTDRISSSESSRKKLRKYGDSERYQRLAVSRSCSYTSITSCSCHSSTDESFEYLKTTIKFTDHYSKSCSEDSMSSSNHGIPPDSPRSVAKEGSPNRSPPPPLYFDSVEKEGEEAKLEQEDEKSISTLSSTSSQSEKRKEKSIIIREYTTTSPSTISRMPADSEFRII